MTILSDEFYYQPIRIDTINTRVFADLVAKEGDANGRGLLVTLTENGLMKDTTGITLILKWEHTSVGNQGLDNFEAVDPSKGLYKITYPTEMLNRGKVRALIRIIDSGKLAGTRNIEITVDRGVGDDTAIASSDSFSALASALIEVQSWNDRIDDVEQDFIDRANNLDATYPTRLVSVEQQLAHKADENEVIGKINLKRDKTRPIELNDVDAEMLAAIAGGEGTSFNLESVPRDYSVSPKKTSFVEMGKNKWDGTYISGYVTSSLNEEVYPTDTPNTYGALVEIENGVHYSISVYSGGNRFRIATINERPSSVAIPALYFDQLSESSGTLEFTNSANAKYLYVFVASDSPSVPNIMVEEGEKTIYEPPSYRFRNLTPKSIDKKHLSDDFNQEMVQLLENALKGNGLEQTVDWEIGGINVTTGNEVSLNNRARTGFIKVQKGEKVKFKGPEYIDGVYVFQYTLSDKSFIKKSNGYTWFYEVDEDCYIRILSRYSDQRVIDTLKEVEDAILIENPNITIDTNVISAIFENRFFINDFIIGGILTSDGSDFNWQGSTRIRSSYVFARKGTEVEFKGTDAMSGLYVFEYSLDNKDFIRSSEGYVDSYIIENDCYIRILSRYSDERVISSPREFDNTFMFNLNASSHVNTSEKKYLFGNFNTLYHTLPCEDVSSSGVFNLNSSVASDIYSEYDDILDKHPHAISKKILGYGGDEAGNADENLPIYEYEFKNAQNGSRTLENNTLTIKIVTGIHGNEKSSTWSALQFFKQLMENWVDNDSLASIKSNVIFKIIPIASPWSYNNNVRANAKGVDLNRNFSYRWDEITDAKGTHPYSELETSILRDWLAEGADVFIDFHNTGETFGTSYLLTPNDSLREMYGSMMRRLTDVWRNKYTNFDEYTSYGWTTNNSRPNTSNEGYHVNGIEKSCILEIAWDYNGVKYTSEVIERGVYLLSNFILAMLYHYNNE